MKAIIIWLAVLVSLPALYAQTEVVLPWVSNNENFVSKIVINNLDPNEAQVILVATRNDGSEQGREMTIPGNGQMVADAGELFATLGSGMGYRVFISSDNQLDAAQVVAGTGTASGSSPAQADSQDPTEAAALLRFNYMPIGDGFSAPVVVNMGLEPANVKFHAYQDGNLAASTTEIEVAVGRPFASVTSDLFPGLTGDFLVMAEADQPMIGTAFLFNANREPSMANAKPAASLPIAPATFNTVTVYEGHVATGGNYDLFGFVYDFGGEIGTPGSPSVAAYNDSGTNTIPLNPEMLLDPESVVLAAGTMPGVENENLPLNDIPVVVGALGITLMRDMVPGVQDAGQTGVGLALPNDTVTLADWLKAEGTMTVVCNNDGTSTVTIAVKNMLPNRIYSVWQALGGPNFAAGPFGGLPNVLATDGQGNGVYRRTVNYCPNNLQEGERPLLWVDLLVHSDQMVYGAIPTTKPNSVDAHVHLEFFGSGMPIQQ